MNQWQNYLLSTNYVADVPTLKAGALQVRKQKLQKVK